MVAILVPVPDDEVALFYGRSLAYYTPVALTLQTELNSWFIVTGSFFNCLTKFEIIKLFDCPWQLVLIIFRVVPNILARKKTS